MPRTALIAPWVLLLAAIIFSIYVPFSYWATNAESFGKYDMGLALFFSFSLYLKNKS
jgi:hypothetical protein